MKKQGYTLLELLLVITVVITIAAITVLMYRRHYVTARVEKTAAEMNQVLEAALAYYVDHQAWPMAQPNCNLAMEAPANDNERFLDF